ncbi:zinc finger, GRF-type containing protein [Tanacetum coccineum]|uniref:Zinc finger, GRF-type containing protein n=1 Tax=Tanacetum coccineum TaxID=301880 RepID=A0ABQ5IVR3_9ASTR
MVICGCGNEAKIKTSWTNKNLGRRFYGCGIEATNYGFFRWVDPPMRERSFDVIPGLLKAKNVLEEDLEDHVLILREKEQMIMKLRKHLVVAYNDVHILFQIAERYGSIDLFVAHKKQRLAEYHLNNIGLYGTDGKVVGWVEEDAKFCCSSSTPFKTRQKRNVLNSKKVHRGVNMKTTDVVRKKQKCLEIGKGNVNEDEEVHVQPRPSGIVIRECGLMNVQENVGVLNNKYQVQSMATCAVIVRAKRVDRERMVVLGLRVIRIQ